jgi:hypothetical protein
MVLPNLIHPVDCIVQRIDKATTFYDHDAREPVQHAARSTSVTLPGQVSWMAGLGQRMREIGQSIEADGYVLFRRADLVAAGFELAVNDRITQMGNVTKEVYIIRLDPSGHYPDQGGYTLMRAWFRDRLPSKERA